VEKALWGVTVVSCGAFISLVMGEYKFDPRAAMDCHLKRFYRSVTYTCFYAITFPVTWIRGLCRRTFPGSDRDRVDARELLACFHVLVRHNFIRSNIGSILEDIFDIFCTGAPPYPISRGDLIRIFRLPILSIAEEKLVMGLVQANIPARPWVSRQVFLRLVSKDTEQGEFGLLTGDTLCRVFQDCCWQRLSPDLRLLVLQGYETASAVKYEGLMEQHQDKLAWRLRCRQLWRRVWARWLEFTALARLIRSARIATMERRAKRGLRQWHTRLVLIKWRKLMDVASEGIGVAHIKKDALYRLKQFKDRMKWIKAYEAKHKPEFIRAGEGCRPLRSVWRLRRIKWAIRVWFDEAWYAGAAATADLHYDHQMLRRNFSALKRYVYKCAERQRRIEYHARVRREAQAELVRKLEEAEEILRRRKQAEEEEAERRRQAVSLHHSALQPCTSL
jgi:hypothetical protein